MASFRVFVIVCLVSAALSMPLEEPATTKKPSEKIDALKTSDATKTTEQPKLAESTGKSFEVTSKASTTPQQSIEQSTQKSESIKPKEKLDARKDSKLISPEPKPEPDKDSKLISPESKPGAVGKSDQQLPGKPKEKPDLLPEEPITPPAVQQPDSLKPEDQQNETLTIITVHAIPQLEPLPVQPNVRQPSVYDHRQFLRPQPPSAASYFSQSWPQQGIPPLHHGFHHRYPHYSDRWDDLYDDDSSSEEDDYEDYLKSSILRHIHSQLPRTSPYSFRHAPVGGFEPSYSRFGQFEPSQQSPHIRRPFVKRDVADQLKEIKNEDKKADLPITKNVEDEVSKSPEMMEKSEKKVDDSSKSDVLGAKRDPMEEKKLEDKVEPSPGKLDQESLKDEDISVIHIIDISPRPSDPFHDANFGSILHDPFFPPFSPLLQPPLPLMRQIPIIVVQPVEVEGDVDTEMENDDQMTTDDKPFEQTKPHEAVVNFKMGQDKARLKMNLPEGRGHYELKNGRGMARTAEYEVEDDGDFKLLDSKNVKDDSKKRMFSLKQGDFKVELSLERAMRQ